MKPFLPYNVLLLITIAAVGCTVLYNLVIRQEYATAIRYHYPVIEESVAAETPKDHVRIYASGAEESGGAADESVQVEGAQELTSVTFPLDLNQATVEQLKFIPQVGDVTAQRIVQYRDYLEGYTDLAQLKEIQGIGEQTYAHLYAYLILDEPEEQAPEETE